MYISGTLHGDEVIGPHAAYYLIEYLLSNYLFDQQVTHFLQSREIIVTPMTNAVGFYHGEREERINRSSAAFTANERNGAIVNASMDINRDFPYNTRSTDCLNTIAGRVVH